MAENLSGMRLDTSGLLHNTGFGKRCILSRASVTQTASGRYSGTYVATSSGTYVIEPLQNDSGAGRSARTDAGFLAETTHVIYGKYDVNALAGDRLAASGETYFYDVLAIHSNPQHKLLEARRVLKS